MRPVRNVGGVRVVVVGSLNMDLIVNVPHLPRAGETVVGDSLLRAAGGKGANQAVAAARLGASVTMIGRVGHDSFGRELTRGLRDEGVSTRWVRGSERPTGAALIEVDDSGENTIAVAPGANADLLPEDVPRGVVEAANVVVAPLEVPMATIEESFRLARLAGVRTVLNAAPAQLVPPSLLAVSDVVICNEVELAMLLGRVVRAGEEAVAARALQSRPEQLVVVTLGERGAVAVTGSEVVQQSSYSVQVVDSTGAGDAFVAGFSIRWQPGEIRAALRLGCGAGALATTRRGAQPAMPTASDVSALIGA